MERNRLNQCISRKKKTIGQSGFILRLEAKYQIIGSESGSKVSVFSKFEKKNRILASDNVF
jgi:hypothetical protein